MGSLLTATCWQGIAGIAQIVAAGLAAYTVHQSRQMLREADEQRRLSVEPYWSVVTGNATELLFPEPGGAPKMQFNVHLRNTGFGPARNPKLEIVWDDDGPVEHNELVTSSGNRVVVDPGQTAQFSFWWPVSEPFSGRLTLTYLSRLGDEVSATFRVAASNKAAKAHDWQIDLLSTHRKRSSADK